MAKSEFITIRVDPEIKRKINRMALSEFMSVSEFIRDRVIQKEKDKTHDKKES